MTNETDNNIKGAGEDAVPYPAQAEERCSRRSLCALGGIFKAIRTFEESFRERHGLCLNEGMLLCRLSGGAMSSSQIADQLGLTNSNASKVIKSVEQKGYIVRKMGDSDKRKMFFELSEKGRDRLNGIDGEAGYVDKLLEAIRGDCENSRGR